MYIDLSGKQSVESIEVSEGVVIDYDDEGCITGIDVDNACMKLDLTKIIYHLY